MHLLIMLLVCSICLFSLYIYVVKNDNFVSIKDWNNYLHTLTIYRFRQYYKILFSVCKSLCSMLRRKTEALKVRSQRISPRTGWVAENTWDTYIASPFFFGATVFPRLGVNRLRLAGNFGVRGARGGNQFGEPWSPSPVV